MEPVRPPGVCVLLQTFFGAFMNQNGLYLLIGALVVVVIGLGAYVYRQESQPSGVELRIDESGVSIEGN